MAECNRCGAGFRPIHGNQRYCTRRCQKAGERERYQAKRVPMACAHCAEEFMGRRWGKNSDHQHRYCSKTCEYEAKAIRFGTPCKHGYPSRNSCPMCPRPSSRKPRAPACRVSQRPFTRRWVAGRCLECGTHFIGRAHALWPARFCSDACIERVARRRYRAKHGRLDGRKRARHYGVAYEPISRTKVFERDGYHCMLCGVKTKASAKVPDPLAPTVDHILPMSKGGAHLYTNVQCACFQCNTRKGAGAANDQLRLVA